MPSMLPGFEYDIFISYRHNDNRSGWVTEFVAALQEELAATIKEPVSVYFDSNPHDGLLETHNVDKSLKGKLKCLIFIPIISQTYCDPKSFAWQHEFVEFNKLAQEDELGRDIKLNNGNVASRILPVKIHDLDSDDTTTIENEIGGVLRSIDFIHKSAGVNRPLTAQDDQLRESGKILYRDQVNKLANAVKEIINGIQNQSKPSFERIVTGVSQPQPKTKKYITMASLAIIILAVLGYFMYPKLTATDEAIVDKSIAVLPFVDISPNHDQQYFSDGMMEEILNNLFKIGGLKITSRTTVMAYQGTSKSIGEIGRELGVGNILEGSVRKEGNKVRITVQLIDSKTDEHRWAENYDRDLTDVFAIQSEVAQKIAAYLKAEISPEVKQRMELPQTKNMEALDLYLRAISYRGSDSQREEEMLYKVIAMDSSFAPAYAELGGIWLSKGIFNGTLEADEAIEHARPFLDKALLLNPNDPATHLHLAGLKLLFEWDFKGALEEIIITNNLNPSFVDVRQINSLLALGDYREALARSKLGYSIDSVAFISALAMSYYYNGQKGEAVKIVNELVQSHQYNIFIGRLYLYLKLYDDVFKLSDEELKSNPNDRMPYALSYLAISGFHTNRKSQIDSILNELKQKSEQSPIGSPAYFISMVYAQMGEIEFAFQWLDKAYQVHEIEMIWLKEEHLFEPLYKDPRWSKLLDKVGFMD